MGAPPRSVTFAPRATVVRPTAVGTSVIVTCTGTGPVSQSELPFGTAATPEPLTTAPGASDGCWSRPSTPQGAEPENVATPGFGRYHPEGWCTASASGTGALAGAVVAFV